MKRYVITLLLAAAIGSLQAQINSPSAEGYIARGRAMYENNNYIGCIDQLTGLNRQSLTPEVSEEVDWLIARANFGLSAADSRPYFTAFLSKYPYSLHRYEALMMIGDCLFESSYAEALKVYQQVDRSCLTDNRAEDLDYHMAYCYLKLAEFERAQTLFDRLSSTKEYGNAARFYKGYIAYAQGDYAAAEKLFKTVNTNTAPGNMADYYLAQIYYLRGDYKQAVSTGRNLLKHRSVAAEYTAEANRIVGESLYELGDRTAAVPYLKKYVSIVDTPQLSTLYILGSVQYESGDYRAVIETLQPVSEGNDEMAQSATLYIGQALMHIGDNDAAILAFDKALKMPFDNEVQETAFYNYAVARFGGASTPFGNSAEIFEQFLSRYPKSQYTAEVQQYIVDGYLSDRNYQAALASINRMTSPSPKVMAAKQKVLYNLGASALATGNPHTAETYLLEADGLNKYDPAIAREVKLLLGDAYYRMGEYDKSIEALRKYISTTPRDGKNLPLSNYYLGYSLFAKKTYNEAEQLFNAGVKSPGYLPANAVADAYNRLGDIRYYDSDFDRATTYYDKAFNTNPQAGDYALFQRGLMKGYQRDHRGKLADLDMLEKQFPTSALLADAMLEETASYIQLGDNSSAIETYRRLVKAYPGTSQGRQGSLQLGLTLDNAGRRAEAADTYRQLISGYPTSQEAREAADNLKRMAAEEGSLNEYMTFINSVEGAPTIDVAEVERLTFEAAEKDYLADARTAKLKKYIDEYPAGAFTANALAYMLEDAQTRAADSDAVSYARQLVSKFPDNSLTETAYIIVAEDEYIAGRTDKSLDAWRALEKRASTSANLNLARRGVMRASSDLGDYKSVETAADAIIASSTAGAEDKNEAIFAKGMAHAGTGDNEGARQIWESIADQTDDIYGAKSAYYLAQNIFDTGDTETARKRVEAFNQSGTPHAYWLARGFILLSDICSAEGKTFEAREYLKALRQNYPGNESDIFMMIDSRLSK